MKSTISQPSHISILAGRDAELSGDLPGVRAALENYWPDVESDLILKGESSAVKAEIKRLAGYYLTQTGDQPRAKDMLSAASDIFKKLNEPHKVIDCQILLANCYWHLGELSEFEAVLEMVGEDEGLCREATIRIKSNQCTALLSRSYFSRAAQILDSTEDLIDNSISTRVVVQFHNIAGIVFQHLGQKDKSRMHLETALELAKAVSHQIYTCRILNELAMWHKKFGAYTEAHSCIQQAAQLACQADAPYYYDTEALIYLEEGKIIEALETVNKALSLYEGTERGYAKSLFTKCLCLVKGDDIAGAFVTFADLKNALQHVDPSSVTYYAAALAVEIAPARTSVYPISLPKWSAEFTIPGTPQFYVCSNPTALGHAETVWTVLTSPPLAEDGSKVLYFDNDDYRIATLAHNVEFDLYLIESDGDFIFLEDPRIVGTFVGYCSLEDAHKETVIFQKL